MHVKHVNVRGQNLLKLAPPETGRAGPVRPAFNRPPRPAKLAVIRGEPLEHTDADQVVRKMEGRAGSEQAAGRLGAKPRGKAAQQEGRKNQLRKESPRKTDGGTVLYRFHKPKNMLLLAATKLNTGEAAFVATNRAC